MKNLKTFLVTICLTFLFTTNTKAQDEDCPECGWYVDGVKVDTLKCYSFDKLQIVLPYNSAMAGYDKISICFAPPGGGQVSAMKTVPASAIKTLVKGNYVVYSLFSKNYGQGTETLTHRWGFESQTWVMHRGCWAYGDRGGVLYGGGKKMATGSKAEDFKFCAYLLGVTITGYTETYDQGTNSIKKTPNYDFQKISKEYNLIGSNRITGKSRLDCDPVDLSQPCTYPGTKVDFNTLGAKPEEIKKEEPVKTTQPAKKKTK